MSPRGEPTISHNGAFFFIEPVDIPLEKIKDRDYTGPHPLIMEKSYEKLASGMATLERLYKSLDLRAQSLKTELDQKFNTILDECAGRLQRVEIKTQDLEEKIVSHGEKLDIQDERIFDIETHLDQNSLQGIQNALLDMSNRVGDLENKFDSATSAGRDSLADDLRDTIWELTRKIEYLSARLKKHDSQIIDINTELKDKYLVINGIVETENEDLVAIVVEEFLSTIEKSPACEIQIERFDIDMVYRTGRYSQSDRFPRPITVIFLYKGMKQELLYWKKQLGWDRVTKVTYTEDFTYDVRQHRESHKAMASRAQHTDHTVKMAGNRIIIDNITYGYDDLDTAPSDLRDAIPKKKNVKGGVAFRGQDCFLSNFHPAPIKISGKQFVSVEQFFQHQKCLACGDYVRAAKILSIDDPVHIKHIGDACEIKDAWLKIRVETLFKAVFFKFDQNRSLARKLLATGNGLYEATTDRMYGCGLGFNSKRWALGDWIGKNLTGTILMRVREILKDKMN